MLIIFNMPIMKMTLTNELHRYFRGPITRFLVARISANFVAHLYICRYFLCLVEIILKHESGSCPKFFLKSFAYYLRISPQDYGKQAYLEAFVLFSFSCCALRFSHQTQLFRFSSSSNFPLGLFSYVIFNNFNFLKFLLSVLVCQDPFSRKIIFVTLVSPQCGAWRTSTTGASTNNQQYTPTCAYL